VTCKEFAVLAQAYLAKDGNSVGGNLHIILDDGNLEDRNIDFCINQAEECGDVDGVVLGKTLRQLSMTQRNKLYKNNWTA
jgi:hypothetical protein